MTRIQIGLMHPNTGDTEWFEGEIEFEAMHSDARGTGAHASLVEMWQGGGDGPYSLPKQRVTGRVVLGALAATRTLTHRVLEK